jgi:hypothetical protein
MDLFFGTNVREHGYSIGRLVGVEVNRQSHAVRNIVVSRTGAIDQDAEKRPIAAVPADHFSGDIVLHAFPGAEESFAPDEVIVLTDATRVMRAERQVGRLSGLELTPGTGEIVSISGRQHWWNKRFQLQAPGLDFSVPGEIRVAAATSQAA